MKKRYSGSCHCGAVRFECELDLADGSRRCNCSFCWKSRMWKVFAFDGDFRLLQGEGALADYQASPSEWPAGDVHHFFCRHCGIRPFSEGWLEVAPFNGRFHAVNIATLDGLGDDELASIPIRYEDGRANRWEAEPGVTAHL